MKKSKSSKQWHTADTKIAGGDYYGTGIRNPMGKIREGFGFTAYKAGDTGKPPKKLA